MASTAGQASCRHGAEAFRPQDMRRPGTGGTEEQHRLFLDGRPAKEELSGYYTTFHNTLHLPDADLTLGEVAKSLVRQYHLGSISQETYEKLWNILTRKAVTEFG